MPTNTFDANLLHTLDALLAEKSVTRAAKRLCISQPAMSGALQRLREYFNDKLLIRMGRDMVLTPFAESLIGPVRKTLLQIQSTLSTRPTFDPKLSQREFNIAMSDYGSLVVMSPLLRRFAAEAPSLKCRVEPLNDTSLRRVEGGELDLIIAVNSCTVIAGQTAGHDLKMRKLHCDDFVCVVDTSHIESEDSFTRKQYERLPHALVRFGPNLQTLVEQSWRREQLNLHVVIVAPSFSSMLMMLPGTGLIATAPRRLAQALAPSLGLRILECPLQIPPLDQILMWHPRNDLDPAHQYLRKSLSRVAGPTGQQPRLTADSPELYLINTPAVNQPGLMLPIS